MSYAETSDVTLASDAELQLIAELRRQLEPELQALAADGRDFPHTTGDIFFTRVLRGNDGDVEKACEWYRNFLKMRASLGLDAVHRKATSRKTPFAATSMPHGEEVIKYYGYFFDEHKLRTHAGHLVRYMAVGGWKLTDMMTKLGEDRLMEFFSWTGEVCRSTIDRLSREDGRMVKVVQIVDFRGAGLWQRDRAYDKFSREKVTPMNKGTNVELMHVLFLVNVPGWGLKILGVLKKAAPPRLLKRVRTLGSDYLQDREFLAEVGPALTKELVALNHTYADSGTSADMMALEGSHWMVGAGSVMERVVDVTQGQTLSWEFRVARKDEVSSERGFLGRLASAATSTFAGTELVFSAHAIWMDVAEDEMERVPVKVRSAGMEHGDAAEFWVDGKPIEHAAGPGINVVAMDPKNRALILSSSYNTAEEPEAASEKLIADLASLPRFCMVLLAVKGTGAEKLSEDALDALRKVGATIRAGHWHQGYALIGCNGGLTVAESRGGDAIAEGGVPTLETEAQLLAPQEVSAESGDQRGSVQAERTGMIMVRWSNLHSFFARKMLANFKVTVA